MTSVPWLQLLRVGFQIARGESMPGSSLELTRSSLVGVYKGPKPVSATKKKLIKSPYLRLGGKKRMSPLHQPPLAVPVMMIAPPVTPQAQKMMKWTVTLVEIEF